MCSHNRCCFRLWSERSPTRFCSKEEAVYSQEFSITPELSLESMAIHDHPCSIYDSREELKRQFVPYLRTGLALSEKCVYFIDENDEDFVIQAMQEDGYDLKPYLFSGQFEIIHTSNAHLNSGHFGEEKMLSYWDESIENAKRSGFRGLRAAVEMTWALSGKPGCEILAPYESRLTNLMREKDASVICMYSRRKFSPEKIKAIIHAHPLVVMSDTVLDNPACPTPKEFVEGSTNLDVQAILDNLELIRELRQTKRELQKSLHDLASFKLLVASVRDYAIFMLDPGGVVRTWNDGAKRIKGYSAEEIIGKHFSTFYTEESKASQHPQKELKIACAEGRYEEEGWRVRKDGTLFWANVIITALYENGELVGFAKVTRDLTERKNAEKAREKAFEEMTKASEELQELAYVISHELQEPVTAITSYSTLLASRYEGRLGSDADDFLSRIRRGARKTARLVDDLWTYARITKPGSLKTGLSSGNILREAKEALHDLIESSGCQLVHSPYASFPAIEGIKEQMLYVFKELITNAIKHNQAGTTPRIEISAEHERNGWTFTFADNGPGIDKFFAQQVFGMYRRLDGKSDETATGMGLPICKKIIEAQHGGRIGFESKQGSGANFFVWLPESSSSTKR